MEYDYCVLSTPSDFYLADAICRELERDGKTCYFNLRDSKKKDASPEQPIKLLNSIRTFVAVVNEEFKSNSKLYMPLNGAITIKHDTVKTFILPSEPIYNMPKEWFKATQLDVSEGITKNIMAQIMGKEVAVPTNAQSTQVLTQAPVSTVTKPVATTTPAPTPTAPTQPAHAKTSGSKALRADRINLLSLIPNPDNCSMTLQRAMRYLKGDGVPQDNERAISLFKKAAVETPEDPTTQFCLGICLESEGSEPNINEAYKAYKKASEAGYVPALTRLAFTSLSLQSKDNAEARELFNKALTMNDPDGAYGLGVLDEVEENYEDAIEHYSEAAELGNPIAQNALGCLYAEGKGIAANEEKAMQWFKLAADQGLPQALFNFGIRLIASNVAENKQQGENMLLEAANQGIEPAQQAMKQIEAAKLAEQRRKEAEQKRQEARNNNNNSNSGWGDFFNEIDFGGLASYAKSRLIDGK